MAPHSLRPGMMPAPEGDPKSGRKTNPSHLRAAYCKVPLKALRKERLFAPAILYQPITFRTQNSQRGVFLFRGRCPKDRRGHNSALAADCNCPEKRRAGSALTTFTRTSSPTKQVYWEVILFTVFLTGPPFGFNDRPKRIF